EEWVPTQTDLFGDTLTITKVDRPATQARLELEGGSRGQFVPSNQSDFLGDVPESPTGIPEAPQPGQRATPHAEGERRRAIAAGREPTAGQLPRPEVGRGI